MPHEIAPAELRQFACELVQLGGDVARRFLGRVSMSRKADNTPVTEADHAVQEEILAVIGRRFPEHAVMVEETVANPARHRGVADSRYCWTVDPIDGTRNFGRGLGLYACSVAVLLDGSPVAGAIHDATSGHVYSAAVGVGAIVDDEPLRLTDRPVDRNAIIALNSFRYRAIPPEVRSWMDTFLFRNTGSLCLHLAWTAAGLIDAAHAIESKLWDIAAGALLIQEAGGLATGHLGEPLWPVDLRTYHGTDIPILAGFPRLHIQMLKSLTNLPAGQERTSSASAV